MYCKKCGAKNEDDSKFCSFCGATIEEAGDYEHPAEFHYAGFWIRFGAILIDGIILGIVGGIVGLVGSFVGFVLGTGYENQIIGIVTSWLYFALLESSSLQGTIGKIAVGIKVIDVDGERISFARATGRYFAKWISGVILCIGYIMAGFTENKQALHDILASTLVIRN